jgi:hypothetical protein
MSREFNEAAHVIGIMVAAIPFGLLLHRSFWNNQAAIRIRRGP